VRDAHPKISHYWTEGGPDYTDPNYQSDYIKWARTFTTNLSNWCRGITVWNLALDQNGRPNIGPFPCGGLVTINSTTKEVTRSGQYYALAHFSKFIERGAKRIESTALNPNSRDYARSIPQSIRRESASADQSRPRENNQHRGRKKCS
jgi:glucosylceramidase